MAQFASAQDLADRLGIELSSAEEARADSLLTIASGLAQAAARQAIERVVDDTFTLRGSRETTVLLPERPVESIASVTLAGTALAAGDTWSLDGDGLVRHAGWGCDRDELVIVYTHGYEEIPDAVKGIVLEAVVRAWVNPGSVISQGSGSITTTFAVQGTPGGLQLTSTEKATLRRLLGRGAQSLAVR